jgi:hypothetical protein
VAFAAADVMAAPVVLRGADERRARQAPATGGLVTKTYDEDPTIFCNPERGWYYPIQPGGGGNPGNLTTPHPPIQAAKLRLLREQGISLIRDCVLIGSYMHRLIGSSYLEEIGRNFAAVREAGLKVIPRFLYDWGDTNRDASESIVNQHIDQLQPLLSANWDVIAYLETGFFGSCGEGWQSEHGYVKDWHLQESGARVVRRVLDALPPERMLAVRFPCYKWTLVGNAPVARYEAYAGTPKARLGTFDDGFLYDAWQLDPVDSDRAREYLAADGQFTVQGGEPSGATDYAKQADAVSECALRHISGLTGRQGEAQELYEVWKQTGTFEQFSRRLGYRFRLLEAQVPQAMTPGGRFELGMTIVNEGFAKPYNARMVEIILRHEQTGAKHLVEVRGPAQNRLWLPAEGETKRLMVTAGLPESAPPGRYELLLNLPDPCPTLRDRPAYSMRLANRGVWEDSTGYNSLCHSVSVDRNAYGEGCTGETMFRPSG